RHAEPYAALESSHHRPPVADAPKGIVFALSGEVQREFDTVKALDRSVVKGLDAEAVGGDTRPQPSRAQVIEDRRVFSVEPVLADAEVYRARRDALTDLLDVSECQL